MDTQVCAGALTLSDDLQVLMREVHRTIADHRISSLLDIGAGDGTLAHRIAQRVAHYLAVEPDTRCVRGLLDRGLGVVCGPFPCPVPGRFGLVLVSRVPHEAYNQASRFLSAAWECVADRGHLMLIMPLADEHTEWCWLLRELEFEMHDLPPSLLAPFICKLGSRSQAVHPITTKVRSSDAEAFVEYLARAASGGNGQLRQTFVNRMTQRASSLLDRYRTSEGFLFPFQYSVRLLAHP